MNVVVFKNEQGSLSVLSTLLDITDAVKIHNLTDYIIVDDSLLPTDPIESWVIDSKGISVDKNKSIQLIRKNMRPLTRYQFMRGMLEYRYKSSDIEAQIMLIEDEYIRELTMIGFKDATNFVRTDPSIDVMRDILGKTDLEIDEFWELCVTF